MDAIPAWPGASGAAFEERRRDIMVMFGDFLIMIGFTLRDNCWRERLLRIVMVPRC